ncbi:hypothetical protein ACRN9A_09320 [Shewanella frigidimarina]|jgi:hypothetical protein
MTAANIDGEAFGFYLCKAQNEPKKKGNQFGCLSRSLWVVINGALAC